MAQPLKTKGIVPKAIIAAAMHKLVHLIYGVLKTRKPFDWNWAKAALETVALLRSHQKIVFLRLTFNTVSDPAIPRGTLPTTTRHAHLAVG